MATGKEDDYSGGSVKASNTDVVEFHCYVCSNNEKHVAARLYCVECAVYLCGNCVMKHYTFANDSLGQHKIVAIGHREGTLAHTVRELPKFPVEETCSEHDGERLTLYCTVHDVVICTVCFHVSHKLCRGVSFIPKLVKDSDDRNDIKRVRDDIANSLESLNDTKVSLQTNQALIDGEMARHINHIHEYTENFIKRARDFENIAVGDIVSRHIITTDMLQNGIGSIDELSWKMKERANCLDSAHDDNNGFRVFVDIKQGKQEVATAAQLQQEVMGTSVEEVVCDCDAMMGQDADNFKNEVQTLFQSTE